MPQSFRAIGIACFVLIAASVAAVAGEPKPIPTTSDVDFQKASGISQKKLDTMLADSLRESGSKAIPLAVSFRNQRNECLLRGEVVFCWKGGEEKVVVPQSGMVSFPLTTERLAELKIRVPADYTRMTQFTFPGGSAFPADATFDSFNVPIINDSEIHENLRRQLVKIQREGKATNIDTLHEQLSRTHHGLNLPEPPTEKLSPEDIYARCRKSVVVMGTLANSGQMIRATGFILDPSGIIVTNYHVMDKQASLVSVIAVYTLDGHAYPVREVLAADQTHDVAIIRIDAKNLPAVTLSKGEQPGAPVTIIAHPADRYYYLTQGYVSRYSRWINCGAPMISMSVTADFCPGSSGGPIFAANGSIAGMVASVKDLGAGMVDKQCVPAQVIRRLVEEETKK